MFLRSAAAKKLGQPVPESNFVSEPKSSAPQQTQWYVPSSCLFQYWPVKAGSVPHWRATWYCSGVNCCCHSWSVLAIFSASFWFIVDPEHEMRGTPESCGPRHPSTSGFGAGAAVENLDRDNLDRENRTKPG